MHLRYHIDSIAGWFGGGAGSATFTRAAELFLLGVPVLGGAVLLALAVRSWDELRGEPELPVGAVAA